MAEKIYSNIDLLAEPVEASHVVNKGYVDGVHSGTSQALGEINGEIDTIKQNLVDMNSDIEENEQDIAELKIDVIDNKAATVQNATDIATNLQTLNDLDARVTSNNTRIQEWGASVDTNINNINANLERITTLEGQVSTNETKLNNLDTRVTQNKEEIDTWKGEVTTNLENIGNNMGRIGDLEDRMDVAENDISDLNTQVAANAATAAANDTRIQGILETLITREYFQGSYQYAATIQGLEGAAGSFAYCLETQTKWVWNVSEGAWEDSGVEIADQTVEKTTTVPLMDGEASIGTETKYAAGDHVHPTDTTRASAAGLMAHILDVQNPHKIVKGDVGLGNVDNTSDLEKPLSSATIAALADKVDKTEGKELSSNDFTDELKAKLDNIEPNANKIIVDVAVDATSENPVQNKAIATAIAAKVDKVTGKQLSTYDFDDVYKQKIDGIDSYIDEKTNLSLQFENLTDAQKAQLKGEKGADGTSVKILGTYANLAALQSAHPTGTNGDSYLIDGSLYVWITNHWENVGYIQGPSGPQGEQGERGLKGDKGDTGPQGPKGETGNSIKILGSYNTAEALRGEQMTGELGDSYLVQGDLYVWNGTAWENVGNISGPKGDQGEQGIQGPKGDPGTSVTILGQYESAAALRAAHPTGSLGQSYIVNGALYVWNGSAWVDAGYIQGPRGPEGPQGEKGEKGDTGTLRVTQILDDNNLPIGVTIYSDTTGTSASLTNGKDGKDGISPAANVVETDTGATIAVADVHGTTIANLKNGKDGQKGDQGVGIASVTKTGTNGVTDTYTITFTDATTSTYQIVNGTTLNKLSQLENDTGYLDATGVSIVSNLVNYYDKNELYTKTEIDSLLTNVSAGLDTQIVEWNENMPNPMNPGEVSTSTIYLKRTAEGSNVFEQFMWIGNNWASLGTTSVNLDNYYNKGEIDNKLSLYASITLMQTLLANYTPTVSLAKVAKTNSYNDLDDLPTIPSIEGLASETYVDTKFAAAAKSADLAAVATSGSYDDLTGKPTIPSIAGLASTTYVDTQIANNKPDLSSYRKKTDAISWNDLTNKPSIPLVDTAMSTTSSNAVQNKVITAEINALKNKQSSPTQASVANIVFGSGGNQRVYRVFCRMKNNNTSGDGEICFIATNIFDFGAVCEGIYLVQCSNRNRAPHMTVTELVAPIGSGSAGSTTTQWGYYTGSDGYFYFGYYSVVYPGSGSFTIVGRDNSNNAEGGKFYNSTTQPSGWTPINIRKMTYQS